MKVLDLGDEEGVGTGGRQVAHPVRRPHLVNPASKLVKPHRDWSNHTASGPEAARSRIRFAVRICDIGAIAVRRPRQRAPHTVNLNASEVIFRSI